MYSVILFAHGSRDPLWHRPVEAVAARMRALAPHVPVRCAYLELSTPALPDAAAELSKVLGLERSIVERYVGNLRFGQVPVTSDILAEQQAIADTFFELKLIPKKLNLRHAAPVNL